MMACEDTLKIKNLPKELTDAEKEDFCRHFGASKVKVITSKAKQKSVVFAKFDSKEIAKAVLFRLHQCYVIRNRLCVEYSDQEIGLPRIKKIEETDVGNKDHFKSFINELNAFNSSVGFHQPPPAHLKYQYPKANRLTINNIGHALASVPKFYTQVLHLMNRMNLPPPFAVEPQRQTVVQQQPLKPMQTEKAPPNNSDDESELESDEEMKQNKNIVPQKRVLPPKKQVKRPKFIKPPTALGQQQLTSKADKTEEVFEKVDVAEKKKIELKLSTSLEPKAIVEEVVGSFGNKQEEDEDKTCDNDEKGEMISENELTANRIPAKDLDVLAVFKNYHPGVPTCRLYLKNIAKNVEQKDLEYIYNRYKVDCGKDKTSQFDIRLMQEGRMKGQAFITLDSVELAQKALSETNAFILKDKPLVVVFAKTASVKK